MLIEFAGAPGSGKTSVASELVSRLRTAGNRAYLSDYAVSIYLGKTLFGRISSPIKGEKRNSILSKYFTLVSPWYLSKFKRNNAIFWQIIDQSLHKREMDHEHLEMIERYFQRMMIYYQFNEDHMVQDEKIVYDEGFVHRSTHFISDREPPVENQIIAYLNNAPKSDLKIFLSVPIDTCLERVKSRGLRGRLKNKSTQEIRMFINNSVDALQISMEFLRENDIQTIQIQNTGVLGDAVTEIESKIMELPKPPASRRVES